MLKTLLKAMSKETLKAEFEKNERVLKKYEYSEGEFETAAEALHMCVMIQNELISRA